LLIILSSGDFSRNWYGKPIFLPQNYDWTIEDADYTPYINYISAVWPGLKHLKFQYVVLRVDDKDVTSYNLPMGKTSLSDPCSHPHALPTSCGTTSKCHYVHLMNY